MMGKSFWTGECYLLNHLVRWYSTAGFLIARNVTSLPPQLKGELSTDLCAWASTLSSGSCPFTDGHTTARSQYCPQAPDTTWCWCLGVSERDIWQSDASAALPAPFPAYHSALFGELGAVPWLHSSIPKAQLLSGCRPERFLKGTLEITGLKGNAVLIVMFLYQRLFLQGRAKKQESLGTSCQKPPQCAMQISRGKTPGNLEWLPHAHRACRCKCHSMSFSALLPTPILICTTKWAEGIGIPFKSTWMYGPRYSQNPFSPKSFPLV